MVSETHLIAILAHFKHFRHIFIITRPDASKVKKLDITDNNSYKCRLFWVWLSDGFVFATSYGNYFITTTPIGLKFDLAIELTSGGN